MPTARNALSAAAMGSVLYAIGGFSGAYLAVVEAYSSTTTSSWSSAAPMPTARNELGVAASEYSIFAVGGGESLWEFQHQPCETSPPTSRQTTAAISPSAHFDMKQPPGTTHDAGENIDIYQVFPVDPLSRDERLNPMRRRSFLGVSEMGDLSEEEGKLNDTDSPVSVVIECPAAPSGIPPSLSLSTNLQLAT